MKKNLFSDLGRNLHGERAKFQNIKNTSRSSSYTVYKQKHLKFQNICQKDKYTSYIHNIHVPVYLKAKIIVCNYF